MSKTFKNGEINSAVTLLVCVCCRSHEASVSCGSCFSGTAVTAGLGVCVRARVCVTWGRPRGGETLASDSPEFAALARGGKNIRLLLTSL